MLIPFITYSWNFIDFVFISLQVSLIFPFLIGEVPIVVPYAYSGCVLFFLMNGNFAF